MDIALGSLALSGPLVGAFLTALVLSILLGSVMRWLSASIGAVVPPRPDRWHSQPTPTMGGVAIAGATSVAFRSVTQGAVSTSATKM